jgi:alpha-tubulin suppressor-like RCC1 family protein
MPRTRTVAVLIGLLALLGVTVAPAAAKPRPALPLTVVIRGLEDQRATVRVRGPRNFDRTLRISDRRRLRNLRPGTYRLRARTVGAASASVPKQRARIDRKRGARVFFNYRVPVPPTPPTPVIPGPITDLRATSVTATSITLAWTNPASGFSGVRVNRTGGPGSLQVSPTQNGLTDSALLSSTAYTYTITTVGTGGDGPTVSLTVATLAAGHIASGGTASCALNQSATASCWGTGSALGTASDPSLTAAPLSGGLAGRHVSAIARGTAHTCGISSGTIFCWGDNTEGQLGIGNNTASTTPVSVALPAGSPGDSIAAPTAAVAIAAGASRSCAIADNSMLYCWGDYGVGTALTPTYVPIPIDGTQRGVKLVGASGERTCVVSTNDQIACFGDAVQQVAGTSGVYAGIAVGALHTCALSSNGTATCFGDNASGQLGTGNNAASTTPVAVAGGITFRALAAGSEVSCGIAINGTGFCWGKGGSGQLGNGGTADANTPQSVQMPAGTVLTAISADTTSCAIDNGIRAFCWGVGNSGQLGTGSTPAQSALPVQVVGYP